MKKPSFPLEDLKARDNKLIDYLGLFFIGTLSLGYLLYYRPFAKLHVDLPFIKAPIFVGEIIFVICFYLFCLKWLINPKKVSIFTYLFLSYFGFVIAKTLMGYFHWGPLALRHSVLFYYPLFMVFSYSFYRNGFFEPNKNLFFGLIFIFIFKFLEFHPYCILTCFALTLVLINSYPKRPVRFILYFLLLFILPYRMFFHTSRTFLTANVLTLVYVGSGFLIISKIKRIYKIIFCLLFISFIFYGLSKISSPNEVRSLIGFENLINRYNKTMGILRVKEPTFVKSKLDVKLYNEKRDVLDQDKIREDIASLFVGFKKKISVSDISVVKNDIVTGANVKQENKKKKTALMNKEVGQGDSRIDVKHGNRDEDRIALTPSKEVGQGDSRIDVKHGNRDEDRIVLNRKVRQLASVSVSDRNIDTSYGNSLFRIFIWKDAFEELKIKCPVFGFDFGKPFRSRTLEILGWGIGEWTRDGWICLHNSYVNIIYRAGIAGILMIAFILIMLFSVIKISFRNRSLTGILLTGILINWFIAANFLEILEMPYSAIPLWSLFGLTVAYVFKNKTV